MDIPTNLKTDLIDTLFSMTENLQYNQDASSNSFGAIFQDQLGSGSLNQESNRQSLSGNRQENSFEQGRVAQKNETQNSSNDNQNQSVKAENEQSSSRPLASNEEPQQNIEISMLDQEAIIVENIEVIVEDEGEKNLELALSTVDNKSIREEDKKDKEDLIKDELIVKTVNDEKNTVVALVETSADNAKIVFFKNNDVENNTLDNNEEKILLEEKDVVTDREFKAVVKNNINEVKEDGNEFLAFSEDQDLEEMSTLDPRQEIEILQKDKEFKTVALNNNVIADLDKNEANQIAFDENKFDASREIKERKNLDQAIDPKEVKSDSSSKFEEIMTRLEQGQQDAYAKTAEAKDLADKSEIKLSSNQIDNKINSSYKQSSQKLMNYQKGQSDAENASNFKIKSDYIENSIFDGKWGKYFGDKLLSLSVQGARQAIIHIEPPELGPVDVRIDMDKEKTSISFTSHHAQVREILEDSTLKLKELFLEQGLSNLEVNVSDKENSGSFFEERTNKSNNSILAENEEENILVQDNRSNGLIDYFV